MVRDVDGILVPGVYAVRQGLSPTQVLWTGLVASVVVIVTLFWGLGLGLLALFAELLRRLVVGLRPRRLWIRSLTLQAADTRIRAEHIRDVRIRATLTNNSIVDIATRRGRFALVAPKLTFEELQWLVEQINTMRARWLRHEGAPPEAVTRLLKAAPTPPPEDPMT